MFDEFHWSRVCSESFLPQVYSLPYLCPKHPTHRRWIIPLGVWVVFLENYFNTYFCWVDGCRCCTCYLCESNPDPPPQIYLNNMPSFLLLFSPSLSPVWLFVTPWTVAHQSPCPLLSSRVFSDSCPLSQWCYITISSSATLFSFCLQSFPASGSVSCSHQVARVLELQL